MISRLLALVLSLLLALPTAAGATLHQCGEHIVVSCACDHRGPAYEADEDTCCSDHSLPASAPAVLSHADAAPDALDPTTLQVVPQLPPDVATELPLEARPAAPPRGPPKIPIFLQNRALLN